MQLEGQVYTINEQVQEIYIEMNIYWKYIYELTVIKGIKLDAIAAFHFQKCWLKAFSQNGY